MRVSGEPLRLRRFDRLLTLVKLPHHSAQVAREDDPAASTPLALQLSNEHPPEARVIGHRQAVRGGDKVHYLATPSHW
jgi:hypothetical protein